MTRTILIVDDDPFIRGSLFDVLTADGYAVSAAGSGAEALASVAQGAPDIILSDVRMDDLDGLALLRLVRERAPSIDVVLMTAFDDMPTVVAAMRDGAVEFLTKPIDLYDLKRVIRGVFADRAARRRAVTSATDTDTQGGLIGRSPSMIAVYKLIGQCANSRSTVLIRGESGTGKELVAHAIHNSSTSASEPFVAVNCAAVPPTLLESELFGHVRGAFTGAVGDRQGRFAQAGKGTIFLDEIGDTSADFQAKLLRVLQDHEYQPVGAERVEHTAARVIAATHRDLEVLVGTHAFREDLYYRLRVMEIVLPPLRHRPGDIPLLVSHMIRRTSTTAGGPMPVLRDDALAKILAHTWPGNVRELENCVTRAVLLAAGKVIRPEHLSIASPSASPSTSPSTASPATPAATADRNALDDLQRAHVARVLAATDGHKGKAAEQLGVSRPRLNRLIEKYGLE